AILRDPAFVGDENGFSVHTRWIETEFDNTIEPFTAPGDAETEETPRQTVVVEVGGRRLEASLPGDPAPAGGNPAGATKATPRPATPRPRRRRARPWWWRSAVAGWKCHCPVTSRSPEAIGRVRPRPNRAGVAAAPR